MVQNPISLSLSDNGAGVLVVLGRVAVLPFHDSGVGQGTSGHGQAPSGGIGAVYHQYLELGTFHRQVAEPNIRNVVAHVQHDILELVVGIAGKQLEPKVGDRAGPHVNVLEVWARVGQNLQARVVLDDLLTGEHLKARRQVGKEMQVVVPGLLGKVYVQSGEGVLVALKHGHYAFVCYVIE